MKRLILLALSAPLFTTVINKCWAQPTIQWQKSFGSSSWDRAEAVVQTSDGNFLICGYAATNDLDAASANQGGDVWLVKLDQEGELIWQKFLGGSGNDGGSAIYRTKDDDYLVVGLSSSTDGDLKNNFGDLDAWIIKVDNDGEILWEKSYGGSSFDWANDLVETDDGDYVVAGLSSSSDGAVSKNQGKQDLWVFKISGDGELIWEKTFGGSGSEDARSIVKATDGGFVLAGFTESMDGDLNRDNFFSDYWILKLDKNGDLQWQKTLGGNNADDAREIKAHPDGGYIVFGYAWSTDGDVQSHTGEFSNGDYWLVRLSEEGEIIWEKTYGGSNLERGYSFDLTEDGGYILTGFSYSSDGLISDNRGINDIWVLKTDAEGEVQWQKSVGGSNEDEGTTVLATEDGGFIITGASWSSDGDATTNKGQSDFWVIKFDAQITATRSFSDLQPLIIYPNPTPGLLTIDKVDPANLQIEIFNAYGHKVAGLSDQREIDLSSFSNGIYWISVKSALGNSFEKIVLHH